MKLTTAPRCYVKSFVQAWFGVWLCIFISHWLVSIVLILVVFRETIPSFREIHAMGIAALIQATVLAIYILPFVPFRHWLVKDKPPFVRPAYALVVVYVAWLPFLLRAGAGVPAHAILQEGGYWEAVIEYQIVSYVTVVLYILLPKLIDRLGVLVQTILSLPVREPPVQTEPRPNPSGPTTPAAG
jgi:hypothetical protein